MDSREEKRILKFLVKDLLSLQKQMENLGSAYPEFRFLGTADLIRGVIHRIESQ